MAQLERAEQERKERERQEQERKRQLELEKQLEKQRELERQREEERRKEIERREVGRGAPCIWGSQLTGTLFFSCELSSHLPSIPEHCMAHPVTSQCLGIATYMLSLFTFL